MKTGGFTLIELAIVIVVLGILAVTAVPKFISLQIEAKNRTLEGLGSAVEGSASLIYNKAYAKRLYKAQAAFIDVDGMSVSISYGYPIADLELWREGYFRLDEYYFKHSKSADDLAVLFYFKETLPLPTSINENCIVYYLAATSSSPASYGVNSCIE